MRVLNLDTKNHLEMADTTNLNNDMTITDFKCLIIQPGYLNDQRVRNIVHPTLRYIQRVLAYTIFGRGETTSVLRHDELFYLYCMLRRNEGEMHFMPHFGCNLAKHLHLVATNTQANGVIIVGVIITKIAKGLHIPTGEDIVEGPITVDLAGLTAMKLIEWLDYDFWVSMGQGEVRYRLPLETPIDPLNKET